MSLFGVKIPEQVFRSNSKHGPRPRLPHGLAIWPCHMALPYGIFIPTRCGAERLKIGSRVPSGPCGGLGAAAPNPIPRVLFCLSEKQSKYTEFLYNEQKRNCHIYIYIRHRAVGTCCVFRSVGEAPFARFKCSSLPGLRSHEVPSWSLRGLRGSKFKVEVGGWKLEVGGWRLEVGGWRLEVGNWRFGIVS